MRNICVLKAQKYGNENQKQEILKGGKYRTKNIHDGEKY